MTRFFSTTASKFCLAAVFTIFAVMVLLGASASGDEFDRIDNAAKKIQKKSRLLSKETVHYRHTAQYPSLVSATSKLCAAASHIHEVAHFQNNLNHLQTDLAAMDHHFYQLESLFKAAKDSASRGHGQIHGNTGYTKSLLRSIENSIDRMRRDVRKLQGRSVSHHQHTRRTPTKATHSATRYHYSLPVAKKIKTHQPKTIRLHPPTRY